MIATPISAGRRGCFRPPIAFRRKEHCAQERALLAQRFSIPVCGQMSLIAQTTSSYADSVGHASCIGIMRTKSSAPQRQKRCNS